MNVNDAWEFVIDYSRVTLQIVVSLTDDSRGIFYDRNMLIVQVNNVESKNIWIILPSQVNIWVESFIPLNSNRFHKFNIGLL